MSTAVESEGPSFAVDTGQDLVELSMEDENAFGRRMAGTPAPRSMTGG